MPKKRKAEVVGTVEAPEMVINESFVEAAIPQVNDLVKDLKTSFDVYKADGVLLRTYTVEIHKEKAEALANEFASHTGGVVR